ncbi:MAG TPA: MFS transporter [Vicinamibacterales bacterium]|nr:MFS transporter [Vicinamibacterales bacterium]
MAINDRREIFAWSMYDWANSGFQATVITVLAGPYLTALAQRDVGENGLVFDLGPLIVTAKSFFPYCIGLSVILQVFLLPVLGAIADYTSLKKRLMALLCYTGSIATCLLFFVTDGRYRLGGLLLVVANLCFGASLVLYNAFLNDIATEDRRDSVSSRGYALGYLGGGILLVLNLGLLRNASALGLDGGLAVRVSLASAGVWWGGFAILTFRVLQERPAAALVPPGSSLFRAGTRVLLDSFVTLRQLPQTRRYLLAYMLFNDGIQTVIAMASVFLSQELFVARGLPEDQSFLVGLILVIQFVAFFGAHLFERVAALIGTKRAIMTTLVIWTGTIFYAYGWLQTTSQAWVMGGIIAVVLGGSQALSRSLFSRMIPAGREASFFGVYEIAERGTSWIGPFLFGVVVAATNSYRQAMLSLIVLFVTGMTALLWTDTARAIRDARRQASM